MTHISFILSLFLGISQPYRIDIFEDYIYGTGLKHEVFKIHKYGKQPVEFLSLGMEKPTNVLISHRYKQQEGRRCKKKSSLSYVSQFIDHIGTTVTRAQCRNVKHIRQ